MVWSESTLIALPDDAQGRGCGERMGKTYKSTFNEKSWPLELPFLAVKLLRKLTGILEVPGILCNGARYLCYSLLLSSSSSLLSLNTLDPNFRMSSAGCGSIPPCLRTGQSHGGRQSAVSFNGDLTRTPLQIFYLSKTGKLNLPFQIFKYQSFPTF